ncbi:class I SAM-dependent methyltransferase [Longimicrobium terrae]|uniref:SAM-dependent methyltransferase n=1 Tax=Longimicrobium terrae TaxID=1639882 RepID=A0A841GKE5_9BACT|nr:class I SAM-dependent methyltransferase [Longimicrobium terrae]MBB4634043.1 SAM-dependent methyltransferase [Longimicrobium terrae]MBB6069067.1 SAM-dependent methyltransferase [Longimicrobium terrae]NNC28242.1 class I SAM-dependent methyltransferase [Longimicrobium terrae]
MPPVSTDQVVAMYSRYPYPTPVVGGGLSYDVANLFSLLCGGDALEGSSVLDAGCGTGQRAVGFAQRYPGARVRGMDAVEPALNVARELATRHAVKNVAFTRGDIMKLEMGETFDFIISTGVVHHLEDPRRGLHNLCRHLSPDGVICVWVYHPFGEMERLIGRELLQTLWGADRGDLAEGQRVMEQLQLRLGAGRYGHGADASQPASRRGQLSADADAFMHPIVHAYRFGQAMDLFRDSGVEWVAVNGINTPEVMKLVDLDGVEDAGREFCLRAEDLFQSGDLARRFDALPRTERYRAIELLMKPTGFTLVAGRGNAAARLTARIAGNAVPTGELPAPDEGIFRV